MKNLTDWSNDEMTEICNNDGTGSLEPINENAVAAIVPAGTTLISEADYARLVALEKWAKDAQDWIRVMEQKDIRNGVASELLCEWNTITADGKEPKVDVNDFGEPLKRTP